MSRHWRPDIFTFLSYRNYLGAYYREAKLHRHGGFSHRLFARLAGYSSPSFIKLVTEGERNVSNVGVERLITAMQMDGEEAAFFRDLVEFDQAKQRRLKRLAFERLSAHRRFRTARPMEAAQYNYLSCWYYPAVRELVSLPGFQDDPVWIARQLNPPITRAEARNCMKLLLELGLIKRTEDGRIALGEGRVMQKTGHEVQILGAGNYHKEMLLRAADSVDIVKPTQRHFNALTMPISVDKIPEFKKRVNAFIESIIDMAEQESEPTCVYQMHVAFFPLTRTRSS